MVGNLGRVVMFLVMFVVVTGLLLLVVAVLSRGIRLAAGYLGYEIGDFWSWVASGWKKSRRRWSRRGKKKEKYPFRCKITEVADHISESQVGKEGTAHRTDNGVIVVFLDDGSHIWGRECKFERIE